MADLLGYRNYSEKDVKQGFTYSGSFPVNKGTFVKIVGDGFRTDMNTNEMLGSMGAAYANTVAQRYGVTPKVTACGTGDAPIGILLLDGKETDENGEQLKFRKRKKDEMEVFISGHSVPIIGRGVFTFSGASVDGTPVAGAIAYVSGGGGITTTNIGTTHGNPVGRFLGVRDANGNVVVEINLPYLGK